MSHIDHEAIADALIKGDTLKSAMLAGGMKPNAAKQGKAKLPKAVTAAMARKLDKAKDMGQFITPQDQENIIRGGLLMNVLKGKDEAVRSYELLGKDKRVNMFAADSQLGVIVLNVPMAITNPVKTIEDNDNEL